jgi:FkbM family methyltransferase
MKKLKSSIYALAKKAGLTNSYLKALFVFKRVFGIKQHDFEKLCQFYRPYIQNGGTVFDIGANVGNRCEIFLALGADVICVEPNKSLFEVLKVRFRLNRRVKIVNAGCGETKSMRKFNLGSNHLTSTFSDKFIELQQRETGQRWSKSVEMQMTTLDDLIGQFGHPAFTKIDVEGYEKEVIMGLNKKVGIISFEFHSPLFNDNSVFCIEKLSHLGYNHFNVSFAESMTFEFDQWVSSDEIKSFINNNERMKNPAYGDFYVK